jgi:multidrug efflux pump subunit AcrB
MGKELRHGDSGRRAADRDARIRLHALHLHRLRADVFPAGIAGYLFRPLAEAVVFAMLASYLLSRTIVPTLVLFFFRAERRKLAAHREAPEKAGWFKRFHERFEHGFDKFRDRYVEALDWCLHNRLLFGALFLSFCAATMFLVPFLGSDLFPTVDSGQLRLHLRAPIGTRVEETAALCDRVEAAIRKTIPPERVERNSRQYRLALQRN